MPDTFAEAMAHHRAGRLDEAAELYRQIIAANPAHADSLNLLGVIAQQKGRGPQAVELIRRAIQIDPGRPAYLVNLASALRGLSRHDEAVRCARAALEMQPDLPEARLALGLSLQATRQWAEAEKQFLWLAQHLPSDGRGPQALANCLREQGRLGEAVVMYREALARNPDDAAAHLGLGTALLGQRDAGAAEPHLKRATQMLPAQAAAWMNHGVCLMRLAREREAVAAFEQALRLAPNDMSLGVNLGEAHLAAGDTTAAENCFHAVLKFKADFPPALRGLADVYRASDRAEEAVPLYERVLQLDPASDSDKGLADALWDIGDVERGAAILRAGIERHPDDPENHVQLASLLASGGDLDGAVACCRAALQIRPGHPPALIELARTLRARLPAEDRARLEEALHAPLTDRVRAGLHFSLAQVSDAAGDFARAADLLRRANELARIDNEAHGRSYDAAQWTRDIERMIEICSGAFFARTRGFGVADERPVFVVGMPRSGTTLIEQILASHAQVHGAGERRFAHHSLVRLAREFGRPEAPLECLDRLDADATRRCATWHLEQLQRLDNGRSARVVDKMPENYWLLGWLAVQFPSARFIHCRRDVRDVALSCWMTNFAQIRWANDLEHLAGRIRNYQRIMSHWRAVLPAPLLEVDYEQLVADQEGESRRLVSWLGLDWDPACLTFYRTERLVKTASVTQVRQPMYRQSVGRWKAYSEALGPLWRELTPEG